MWVRTGIVERRIVLGLLALTILSLVSWIYLSESIYSWSFGALRLLNIDQATTPPFTVDPFGNLNSSESPQVIGAGVHQEATYPIPELKLDKDPYAWNTRQLQEMYRCINRADTQGRVNGHSQKKHRKCHPNRSEIVVLASGDAIQGIWGTWRRGESIWGEAMFKAFYQLGYTVLIHEYWNEAAEMYRDHGSRIKVVIGERPGRCIYDPKCIKNTENPEGIPIWKIFDMNYFPNLSWFGTPTHATPLGGPWIISAVDNGPDYAYQYIGYSIEDNCTPLPVLPPEKRENRVYILMKELAYAHFESAWNTSFYVRAADELDIRFVAGYNNSPDFKPGGRPPPEGGWAEIEVPGKVDNLHQLSREQFLQEVGKSKLLLGVGLPKWSPSPYDALCLGVPFLNPIRSFDRDDPLNQKKWKTQHPELTRFGIGPPYVYTVFPGDYAGFSEAISKAISTPIGRYIAPHMKREAFHRRLESLVTTDWKSRVLGLGDGWRADAAALHDEEGKKLEIDFTF